VRLTLALAVIVAVAGATLYALRRRRINSSECEALWV
jgi:hypothetical protein